MININPNPNRTPKANPAPANTTAFRSIRTVNVVAALQSGRLSGERWFTLPFGHKTRCVVIGS